MTGSSSVAGKPITAVACFCDPVDFLGGYNLPVGKLSFSIENLLDKEYTTVWGQRAPGFYSPTYGAANLYTYKGRGRTFGLNYSVVF